MAPCVQGPNLGGLFGRQSGTMEGFSYSKANKEKAVHWDEVRRRSATVQHKRSFSPLSGVASAKHGHTRSHCCLQPLEPPASLYVTRASAQLADGGVCAVSQNTLYD